VNRRGTEGFVTVATFTNSLEANLAKQHLEAGGVRCFLRDESTVDVAWHLSVAVGWIKLPVQMYSLWLLMRLWISRQQVSANRKIKVIVALCLDLLSLFILWNIFLR
jgi:hypothetical protein